MRSCSASATIDTAVTCGTPTPATMRVVQIEPGPTPTFTASRAGVHQRQRGIAGDDVAADHLQAREVLLTGPDAVDHALRMAVRGIDDHHVHAAATSASMRCSVSPPTPTAAPTSNRPLPSCWRRSGCRISSGCP